MRIRIIGYWGCALQKQKLFVGSVFRDTFSLIFRRPTLFFFVVLATTVALIVSSTTDYMIAIFLPYLFSIAFIVDTYLILLRERRLRYTTSIINSVMKLHHLFIIMLLLLLLVVAWYFIAGTILSGLVNFTFTNVFPFTNFEQETMVKIFMGLPWLMIFVLFCAITISILVPASVWGLAIPACIADGVGPLASLQHSRSITKGNRIKISAIIFILISSYAGGKYFLSILTKLFETDSYVNDVCAIILFHSFLVFVFMLLPVIYHHVTGERQIASVFD